MKKNSIWLVMSIMLVAFAMTSYSAYAEVPRTIQGNNCSGDDDDKKESMGETAAEKISLASACKGKCDGPPKGDSCSGGDDDKKESMEETSSAKMILAGACKGKCDGPPKGDGCCPNDKCKGKGKGDTYSTAAALCGGSIWS